MQETLMIPQPSWVPGGPPVPLCMASVGSRPFLPQRVDSLEAIESCLWVDWGTLPPVLGAW